MFFSVEQISRSLERLQNLHPFFGMSFLAFKEEDIPIGDVRQLNFSVIVEKVLKRHYRPCPTYAGFYNPFVTSRRDNRWVRPRYGSTTLQRITKDTFQDALLHPTEQEWGWKDGYVQILRDNHLKTALISAFDLAVWLFREEEWPEKMTPKRVVDRFVKRYRITEHEQCHLFADTFDAVDNWLSTIPVSEPELLRLVGPPPGTPPPTGAALRSLELRGIGPAKRLRYQPADRLNIITGDNSLGKTFLLDCIWWALTRSWVSEPAYPQRHLPKSFPAIAARLGTPTGIPQSFHVKYDWNRQEWDIPQHKQEILAGLAVYARYDGAFAVWDPARPDSAKKSRDTRSQHIVLSRDDVWNGMSASTPPERICNGLLV